MIESLLLHACLVLFRVASFVSFFPVFSGRRLPRLVKVGLIVSLSSIWICQPPLHHQLPAFGAEQHAWLALASMALREALLGAAIGFAFGLLLEPVRMAGAYIGQEMGLSLASIADPSTGVPIAIVSQLFEWIAVVMMFSLNLHHVLLYALHLSLNAIGVGQPAAVLPALELFRQADMAHDWSLLIAAPVAIVLFLTLVSMGLLMRAVPQMNIFSIGFALRIMFGFASLILFMPVIIQMVARSLSQTTIILNLF